LIYSCWVLERRRRAFWDTLSSVIWGKEHKTKRANRKEKKKTARDRGAQIGQEAGRDSFLFNFLLMLYLSSAGWYTQQSKKKREEESILSCVGQKRGNEPEQQSKKERKGGAF